VPGRPSAVERYTRWRTLAEAGRAAEGIAYLRAAASDLADDDREGAARLLVESVQPTLLLYGPERALEVAHATVAMAAGTASAAEVRALTRLGDAYAWSGRYADAQEAWNRAAVIGADRAPSVLCERANALLRAGSLDAARDAAYEAVVRSREAESRADLLDALALAGTAEVHLGNLREGLDAAEQSMAATEGESGMDRLDALAFLAWITALLGDVDRAKAALTEAKSLIADRRMTAPGGLVAGMLALGEARFQDAVDAFEAKTTEQPMTPAAQVISLRPFVPALAEAYAYVGRNDEARVLVGRFLESAVNSGQAHLAAPALRAKGVAEEDDAAFDEALRWHAGWGNRFEEGRTLLARGEQLRRRKQRAAARRDLSAAVKLFEQVGATTWQARAASELRAAGERSAAIRPRIAIGPEALSQQEASIVELVAAGLSNREIAARLFLSVKTVEGHLTTIYGKLGIRSRSQLLAALLGGRRDDAESG
jgi:ATP/maltotriose-dependent transcriptional regulator MalT